jgi:hypothetical protein
MFAMMGMLPKVASRLGVEKTQLRSAIDVVSVLQFLKDSQKRARRRRFAVLATRFLATLSPEELESVGTMMIGSLGSKDEVVRYLALMFVKVLFTQGVALPD